MEGDPWPAGLQGVSGRRGPLLDSRQDKDFIEDAQMRFPEGIASNREGVADVDPTLSIADNADKMIIQCNQNSHNTSLTRQPRLNRPGLNRRLQNPNPAFGVQ